MRKVTLQLGRVEAEAAAAPAPARSAPPFSPSLSSSLPPRIFVSTYHDGSWGSHQGSPPPFPSLCEKYRPIRPLDAGSGRGRRGRVGEDIQFPNRHHFTRPIGSFSVLFIHHSHPIFRPLLCASSLSTYLRIHKESEDKRAGCKSEQ